MHNQQQPVTDQPPKPKLFILASSLGAAQEFAAKNQLMPGWVFVRNVESLRGTHGVPVVAVSGWSNRLSNAAVTEVHRAMLEREVRQVTEEELDPWRRPDARRHENQAGSWLVRCRAWGCQHYWVTSMLAALEAPAHTATYGTGWGCNGIGHPGVVVQNLADAAAASRRTVDAVTAHVDPAKYQTTDRLVWLDLETTGLKVGADMLLEIACLVTEGDLTPVDAGYTAVIRADRWLLDRMAPDVQEMHTSSGLVDEVLRSTITLEDAYAAALDYVRSHVPAKTVPAAGSSVSFDRKFLAVHMPELDDHLHYRIVDVSSVKELVRRWYPAVYAQLPARDRAHRAMPDVMASIAELKFYRTSSFVGTIIA